MLDARKIVKMCHDPSLGLDSYGEVMRLYHESENLERDDVFHRRFNWFYRVRRSKVKWQPHFFHIFEELRSGKRALDFRAVLATMRGKGGFIDASFVSKMFATVDPSLPIIDQNVLLNTGLGQIKGGGDVKFENAVKKYEDLKTWVYTHLDSVEGRDEIRIFDEVFPSCAKSVSDVKKLDCLLWGMGFMKMKVGQS